MEQSESQLRLRGLELFDFKCFERLRLDFDRGTELGGYWTCIAGINGAGKSSILQAVALLGLGPYYAAELGRQRLARLVRRRGAEIGGEFEIRAQALIGEEERDLSFRNGGEGLVGRHLLLGYGPSRTFANRASEGLVSLSLECGRVYSLFESLTPLVSQQQFMQRNGDIPDGFRRLFPAAIGAVLEEDLEFGAGTEELSFSRDGAVVGVEELPDGYRSTVAWVADLIWNWTKMRPETERPEEVQGLVLIDEIDLHLHPQLQRMLVPRLRRVFPRVQWIVTTHSPLVLSCFDKDEIVLLDRDREEGFEPVLQQVFGLGVNQIMERLMGARASGGPLQFMLEEAEENPEARQRVTMLMSGEEPVLSPSEIGAMMRKLKK